MPHHRSRNTAPLFFYVEIAHKIAEAFKNSFYLTVMAYPQDVPLRERYADFLLDAAKKKSREIDSVKEGRLEEVDKLAKSALKVNMKIKQTYHELPSTGIMPGPAVSVRNYVLPPTPPRSPVRCEDSVEGPEAIQPAAERLEPRELEELRTSLRNHERQISSLKLQLGQTQREVVDINSQYQKASRDYASAVSNNDEGNIVKAEESRQRLLDLLNERDISINQLQDEIVTRKRCEGELKERLAEAEGRLDAKAKMRTDIDRVANDSSTKVGENVRKEKKGLAKRESDVRQNTDWEFRRKKGEKKTPISAGYSILKGKKQV